ncbi:hypothetical protein LF887_13910 [Chryseobacterium sp. MEBOG06]|uniref:hypothetical protein n=1 Tax=Chryseobacterium sp. MEBOG06 TaxID=2879938 RepID=UPI001F45E9D1|nr:hypothetical protein [Chryseobacterium sp. MEBOG06]UKB82102.1 hypothetical protein LF887_13910 [Chryseobacterium sp. MEBOG06]
MKTKKDFEIEIEKAYEKCRMNIINASKNIKKEDDLIIFYNNSMQELYSFMPYYSFYIYLSELSYEDSLEVNGYGLLKSKELHDLYTELFLTRRRVFDNL